MIEVLATLAEIAIQRRDYEQALSYIDRQLVFDDLNEHAHRQKIEALYWAGRRVEAMPGIEALLMTFGEIDPDTPVGDPLSRARIRRRHSRHDRDDDAERVVKPDRPESLP